MKNGGMNLAIQPERDALPRDTSQNLLARHRLHCVSHDSSGAVAGRLVNVSGVGSRRGAGVESRPQTFFFSASPCAEK